MFKANKFLSRYNLRVFLEGKSIIVQDETGLVAGKLTLRYDDEICVDLNLANKKRIFGDVPIPTITKWFEILKIEIAEDILLKDKV